MITVYRLRIVDTFDDLLDTIETFDDQEYLWVQCGYNLDRPRKTAAGSMKRSRYGTIPYQPKVNLE